MKSSMTTINGLQYKIGAHGFAYYFLNGEWIKSDKPPEVIKSQIDKESLKTGQNRLK